MEKERIVFLLQIDIVTIFSYTSYGTKYSRMDQVKFVEESLKRFEGVWSALKRQYSFKFFKGCSPQILLGPFLNTLHLIFFYR